MALWGWTRRDIGARQPVRRARSGGAGIARRCARHRRMRRGGPQSARSVWGVAGAQRRHREPPPRGGADRRGLGRAPESRMARAAEPRNLRPRRSSSTASCTRRTCGRTCLRSSSTPARCCGRGHTMGRHRPERRQRRRRPRVRRNAHGVFALDADTGRVLWSTTVARHNGDLVDMAPGVHDDTVYASTAVAGDGAIGTLWALDAQSGTTSVEVADGPLGPVGRPQGQLRRRPVAPARVRRAGRPLRQHRQPAPVPRPARPPVGRHAPGPDRWTNSIVKLDERSGRIVWAHQVLPHDIYDWDLEGPVILDRVDGRLLAITAGKMGFVYAFDAADGSRAGSARSGCTTATTATTCSRCAATSIRARADEVLPGWVGRRRDADGVRRQNRLRAGQQPRDRLRRAGS